MPYKEEVARPAFGSKAYREQLIQGLYIRLRETKAARNILAYYRDPNCMWPGGVRVGVLKQEQGLYDMFLPTDEGWIKRMLKPMEIIMKKSCYINKRAQMSSLVAKHLVGRK